jgi:hypothetical protein
MARAVAGVLVLLLLFAVAPFLALRAGFPVAGVLGVFVLGVLLALLWLVTTEKRKARRAGYPTLGAYLAATPRTDAEKRAAADLALKGVVICFLGLLFPPLILFGLIPLYFGARKVIHAALGLGLAEDIDDPGDPGDHGEVVQPRA